MIGVKKPSENAKKNNVKQVFDDKSNSDCVGRKKVLLSYITRPFVGEYDPKKQNDVHAIKIAEYFRNRGYKVDVVWYRCNDLSEICFEFYDIVFGMGFPFEESIKKTGRKGKIFFATGAHSTQRLSSSVKRSDYFQQRNNKWLGVQRIKPYSDVLSAVGSELILTTGNEWTASTYKAVTDVQISTVPINVANLENISFHHRSWPGAKNRYFWMGGKGPLLKGLDLVLDSFIHHRHDCELHIAGNLDCAFANYYQDVMKNDERITYHGFLDTSGSRFVSVIKECGFIIFPGASEAGCTSVLTAMASGMIPILTKESSIDIAGCGFWIEQDSVEAVASAINVVRNKSEAELMELSRKCREFVLENHSIQIFEENLVKHLDSYLGL